MPETSQRLAEDAYPPTVVAARHELTVRHKLVFELGWCAYFRHVWRHRVATIEQSLHPGPLPDDCYAASLPADFRQACTGVLHNHARMWLASDVVHVRKVHWRAGADWLYGHLLDGHLASATELLANREDAFP